MPGSVIVAGARTPFGNLSGALADLSLRHLPRERERFRQQVVQRLAQAQPLPQQGRGLAHAGVVAAAYLGFHRVDARQNPPELHKPKRVGEPVQGQKGQKFLLYNRRIRVL